MSEKRFAAMMMAPAILFLGILVAYPIVTLVTNSFFQVDLLAPSARVWRGLENYADVLTSARLRDASLRTIRYTMHSYATDNPENERY